MNDSNVDTSILLVLLLVVATFFMHDHPKTEYEVNGIVVGLSDCIAPQKGACFKKIKQIKIAYSKNSSKVHFMLYDLGGEPIQSLYELDKCSVMNEEIFGCEGLARRGSEIQIESAKVRNYTNNAMFLRVITSKVYKFLPDDWLLTADEVNFIQKWIF